MASTSNFNDQLASLRSLMDQTESELSQSRIRPHSSVTSSSPLPSSTISTISTLSTRSNMNSTNNKTVISTNLEDLNSLSVQATGEIRQLRQDFQKQSQSTSELVSFIESDIKAGKMLSEETADRLARVTSTMESLSERLRTVEAKQSDIWNTLQKRPTRSEVNSTVSATLLPTTSYTKTRLDSLANSLSLLQGEVDHLKTFSSNNLNRGDSNIGSNGNTSMSYIEQRLERRLEDFVERKMRLRARQLEKDIVEAVHNSLNGVANSKKTMTKAPKDEENKLVENNNHQKENEGDLMGNSTIDGMKNASLPPPATAKELEMVKEQFSKEVRLVQNSLISLRTQLRMLGRDIKIIKEK